ncbi:hypothetical protein FDP41_001544 [Naegleria fowleri]|uniref:Uncharacterized protein n=1 Tax=Naegleria fowleri TaxID=5763 RepID=A0A6A5BXH0_NAEFO|nr:uncharacterized protein FDP41_001544 [Naegleria fowleri]KAF0979201.1 hypothetical protein FDP41_001544 [Naegleria fowleri]CAG4718506.1 unnamed protein product [Naegleria fowleri]
MSQPLGARKGCLSSLPSQQQLLLHRNHVEKEQESNDRMSFQNSHGIMMNENNFDDDLESVALSRNEDELEDELPSSPTVAPCTPNHKNRHENTSDEISELPEISPFQSPYVTRSSRKSRTELMYSNVYGRKKPQKVSNREIENRLRNDFPERAKELERRHKERLQARQFTPACCDAILGLGFIEPSFMMLGDSATSKLRSTNTAKRDNDGSQSEFESPEKKIKSCEDPFEFYSPPPLSQKDPATPQEKLAKQIIARLRKVSKRWDVSQIISKDNIDLIALTKATNPDCELFKSVKGPQRDMYIQEIVSVVKEFTSVASGSFNDQQENHVSTSRAVKREENSVNDSSLNANAVSSSIHHSTIVKKEKDNNEKHSIETPRKNRDHVIKLENMESPNLLNTVKLQKNTTLTPKSYEQQTNACSSSTPHKSPSPINITNRRVLATPSVDAVIIIDDDDQDEDDCKFLCKKEPTKV